MPSYKERSRLIKALSEQEYFDAETKPNTNIQIGAKRGDTGRYEVIHSDGGTTSNGDKIFNASAPQDGFVRGNSSGNAIALESRNIKRTQAVPQQEEEAQASNIIVLFLKDNKLYVGGDRAEPEQIYELETNFEFVYYSINKTGFDRDDFVVNFAIRYVFDFGKLYKFCVFQNNQITEVEKNITDPIYSFLAIDISQPSIPIYPPTRVLGWQFSATPASGKFVGGIDFPFSTIEEGTFTSIENGLTSPYSNLVSGIVSASITVFDSVVNISPTVTGFLLDSSFRFVEGEGDLFPSVLLDGIEMTLFNDFGRTNVKRFGSESTKSNLYLSFRQPRYLPSVCFQQGILTGLVFSLPRITDAPPVFGFSYNTKFTSLFVNFSEDIEINGEIVLVVPTFLNFEATYTSLPLYYNNENFIDANVYAKNKGLEADSEGNEVSGGALSGVQDSVLAIGIGAASALISRYDVPSGEDRVLLYTSETPVQNLLSDYIPPSSLYESTEDNRIGVNILNRQLFFTPNLSQNTCYVLSRFPLDSDNKVEEQGEVDAIIGTIAEGVAFELIKIAYVGITEEFKDFIVDASFLG